MSKTKWLANASLFIALVFVATYAVQIPLPGLATGGLIHLGNVALFTIAIVFGKKFGAVSGAFGMALFDVLSPWVIWAPGTFIIRGIMGYAVGKIAEGGKKRTMLRTFLAMLLPSIWMIFGYFVYNLMLYQDMPAAIASLPGDVTQIVMGIVIAFPVIQALERSKMDVRLRSVSGIAQEVRKDRSAA